MSNICLGQDSLAVKLDTNSTSKNTNLNIVDSTTAQRELDSNSDLAVEIDNILNSLDDNPKNVDSTGLINSQESSATNPETIVNLSKDIGNSLETEAVEKEVNKVDEVKANTEIIEVKESVKDTTVKSDVIDVMVEDKSSEVVIASDSAGFVIEEVNADTLVYSDTASKEEANIFINDAETLIDSINEDTTVLVYDYPVDTTTPYNVHFIKEFQLTSGMYHYLLMDAQHNEKLLSKSNLRNKKPHYTYEDLIVKVEIIGSKLNLYSVVFSEPIIGSLERFDKFYYVSDGERILRVKEKTGHGNFFKDFEKLYLDSNEEILKGKKFKNVFGLVNFWNDYSVEVVQEVENTDKTE